jgi:hypothetical protein
MSEYNEDQRRGQNKDYFKDNFNIWLFVLASSFEHLNIWGWQISKKIKIKISDEVVHVLR